jgi:hypothetical protein
LGKRIKKSYYEKCLYHRRRPKHNRNNRIRPEINIGEVKKAGKEYLIIKDPNKIPHNIGLDNIFVYKEGEDF